MLPKLISKGENKTVINVWNCMLVHYGEYLWRERIICLSYLKLNKLLLSIDYYEYSWDFLPDSPLFYFHTLFLYELLNPLHFNYDL